MKDGVHSADGRDTTFPQTQLEPHSDVTQHRQSRDLRAVSAQRCRMTFMSCHDTVHDSMHESVTITKDHKILNDNKQFFVWCEFFPTVMDLANNLSFLTTLDKIFYTKLYYTSHICIKVTDSNLR